jgi:serralysin
MSTEVSSERLFSRLVDPSPQEELMRGWSCYCPACATEGQGGNTPGDFATTPTDSAWGFVAQAQAPVQGSGGNVAALMAGSKWSSLDSATSKTVVTYSFADPAGSTYVYGPTSQFQATLSAFSAADQQLTREILGRIEAVCNVQFVEVADNATECGVLRYGYSEQPNAMNFSGYAFFPSTGTAGGDIWIGADQAEANWDFYRPNLILHETLHAMGLKHPFDSGATLSTAQNIIPNTVMSYSAVAGSSSGYLSQYPSEPMPLDVAALQYLYGSNSGTNGGNTVYDLAGADFQSGFQCVWDGSGSDVFDASRIGHGVTLDLNGGALSSVGASVSAAGYSATGTTRATYTSTVSVASGAVIENAVGSDHADTLAGNAAGNWLLAGLGNDRLEGRGGNDILDGGDGLDTAAYAAPRAGYSVTQASTGFLVASGATGADSVVNVERLSFTDTRVALDLDGNAGAVAKLLGAVFGATAVDNTQFAGIGLNLLDGGLSAQGLAQRALDMQLGGGADNQAVVDLLYTNVTGTAPSQDVRDSYVALLEQGTFTQASLAQLAADTALNLAHIDFVGLAAHGLDYVV